MLAVLGSTALNKYKFVRDPVDMDILGDYDSLQSYFKEVGKNEKIVANYPSDSGRKIIVKTDKRIIEAEVAWPDSDSERLLEICLNESHPELHEGMVVPSLDVLYMLKMSHRFRKNSPHFLKTLRDIQLMKSMGAKIRPEYEEWLTWREEITYKNQLPKLNVSKKEFFSGDNVPYIYEHDSLHEAIKFKDVPAYTLFSGGEVWSDMKKFETLAEEDKLLAVLEEACVLAAERSQTAFNPPPDKRWSFEFALSKVCTSITSGKFRSYSYENYDKVVAMYDDFGHTYMDKVNEGISTGVVKPFKEAA